MTGETTPGRLHALALEAGAGDLAAEVAALEERVREQRFHLACVGQFKRGKSTLVNALVGLPLLPTGVIPVTSVPTLVRHGQLSARVRFSDGWRAVPMDCLAEFVTEQQNPGNSKGVMAIEVLTPSTILEQGLCLVDTPGLGSVTEANSAATREFVPHIDAALVVVGADPPISGEELRLVEAIAAEVETLIFVVNKVDRVTTDEREEAIAFVRQVLADRLSVQADRFYRVSAIAGGSGPDWADLVQRLRLLAGSYRESLVTAALRRGMARIGGALAARLSERVSALTRPIEESTRRVDELRQLTRSTERELRELHPLFGAEEQRLVRAFEERAKAFLAAALPAGTAALRTDWSEGRFDQASRSEGLEAANLLARRLVYPWLTQSERVAEAEFQESVRTFTRLGTEHLARLGEVASVDPAAFNTLALPAEGLRHGRHFAFSDRMHYHHPRSPWPRLLDALLPARTRRRRRQAAAARYLEDLLTVNASRVAGDLAERVRESRRGIEAEIRALLRRVYQAAADALEWSGAVRARGVEEVEREVARLEGLGSELEHLLQPTRERAA